MCYNKELSLTSFGIGLISSLVLIKLGNKESINTNKAIGIFIIFVSLMQLIDYFIWSDLDCKKGTNKIATFLGPIFNYLQPVIFAILTNYYLKSNNIIPMNYIILFNTVYVLYLLYILYIIHKKSNYCTKQGNSGHLNWPWKHYFWLYAFFIISFINYTNFINNKNILTLIIISYIILLLSITKVKEAAGELWCYFVPSLPFVLFGMQKIFNINN